MKISQRVAIAYIRTKFKLLSAISKKKAAKEAFTLFCTPQHRNKKTAPKIFNQGEKLHFSMKKLVINGWRWNSGGSKKVLILHGFESTVTNFDRYIGPLIRKGYEVLAFDAPAHGGSSGDTITAPLYSEMIVKIHEKYGPIKSYMAHSLGGLALSLAIEKIKHSDEFRLVFIAPATETTTAIDSFFNFLRLDKGVREEFEKIILKSSSVGAEWFSIKRALKNINAKVLWFHDEDDDTTPLSDVLKVKEANYPNVEFVFTTGLGHRKIYRDNKVTRAIIDFL
jgi:pimeloyl-ACP methyl ester carboxylesterase